MGGIGVAIDGVVADNTGEGLASVTVVAGGKALVTATLPEGPGAAAGLPRRQ